VQRRAVKSPLDGVPLGGANQFADASSRFAEPPGADQRSGRLCCRGYGELYAFAQSWLVRQDVRKFAWVLKDENYHNFHTSYCFAWLQMLMDYYDYTGNKALVEEMAPYVHALLDTCTSWLGTNGIISEAPNYMFMGWISIGGLPCHHPPAVIGQGYFTAFYIHSLDMASRVADLMDDRGREEKYKILREQVSEAFERELWVADKDLYRDGKPFQTQVKPGKWLPADSDIESFSPHVNLLAVLYDIAPKAAQTSIVEKVFAEKPPNTSPWFMHWAFQAIDHAGLFDRYGTQQLRRWRVVPETQSFRETWNEGDLSHGWCSTPLVQMSARILGVTPASPGFRTIRIAPHVCDLIWASGKVPTPHGDVKVSWKWAKDRVMLDVTVPVGTEVDVILPAKTEHVLPGQHHFESAYKVGNPDVPLSRDCGEGGLSPHCY
jgi:alpha-L-rhamnosidase